MSCFPSCLLCSLLPARLAVVVACCCPAAPQLLLRLLSACHYQHQSRHPPLAVFSFSCGPACTPIHMIFALFWLPAQVRDCGKMALLERLLNRLLPNGHKVLIFSQVSRTRKLRFDR